MSKSIRIVVPIPKERNPLVMNGGKGSGIQIMKDRRTKRSKDHKKSWRRDNQVNG